MIEPSKREAILRTCSPETKEYILALEKKVEELKKEAEEEWQRSLWGE